MHGPAPDVGGEPRGGELVDDMGLTAMLVHFNAPVGEVRALRDAVAEFLVPTPARAPRLTQEQVETFLDKPYNLEFLKGLIKRRPALVNSCVDDDRMEGVRDYIVRKAFGSVREALRLLSGLVLQAAAPPPSQTPHPISSTPN